MGASVCLKGNKIRVVFWLGVFLESRTGMGGLWLWREPLVRYLLSVHSTKSAAREIGSFSVAATRLVCFVFRACVGFDGLACVREAFRQHRMGLSVPDWLWQWTLGAPTQPGINLVELGAEVQHQPGDRLGREKPYEHRMAMITFRRPACRQSSEIVQNRWFAHARPYTTSSRWISSTLARSRRTWLASRKRSIRRPVRTGRGLAHANGPLT